MVFISYYFGWKDLIANDQLTGSFGKDFMKSVSYYIGWVLPYWWIIILVGSLLLSLIGFGVKIGVDKIRG